MIWKRLQSALVIPPVITLILWAPSEDRDPFQGDLGLSWEGMIFLSFLPLLILVVGPWLGRKVYSGVRFIALRFVEPKWASLMAVLVSSGLCLLGTVTFLGAGVAGYLFWKDMGELTPKGTTPEDPKS
jgi:hypothetical protein